MARHILIVDDDADIRSVVHQYLSDEGYEVSCADSGKEMRCIVSRSAVDLVLLDVMLPGEDGLSLARSLRAEHPCIGIIMLTGRGDTVDRIIGLEMGADDYVAKPFHVRELLARIKSVERRATALTIPAASDGERFQFEGWQIDLMRRELTSPAGEDVRITSGEFDLLAVFVSHPNQVLSRDRLLELGRNREGGPFDRTIDVQVGRLRRKLGDDPKQPRLIRTVRSGGYLFAVPVGRPGNPRAFRP